MSIVFTNVRILDCSGDAAFDGEVRVRGMLRELAIVFLGVLLALAAENYREQLSERRQVEESLAVMITDLRADSLALARVGRFFRSRTAEIAWLLENRDRTPPTDSVETVLYSVYSTRQTWEFRQAGYAQMQSSGHLGTIRPDSLRDAVLRYYQGRQPSLKRWSDDLDEMMFRAMTEAAPHLLNPVGAEAGTLWPPAEERVRLRTSWEAFASDGEAEMFILQSGRVMDFLAGTFANGEAATGQLMAMIREEIPSPRTETDRD